MTFNYKEFNKILIESFIRVNKWNLWNYLIPGSFGVLLSFLQIGKNFFNISIGKSALFALIAIVLMFLIRFLAAFMIGLFKYFHDVYKNDIYGNAIIILKDSFALLHHYRKTPGHQDEQFISTMVAMCNNLKKIFDEITHSQCSVSIKVPLLDKMITAETILVNLIRDTEHSKKDTSLNRDTNIYCATKHTLFGNTAFINCFNKVISDRPDKYYKNNNVNKSENYENTSRECHSDKILPYNSELVLPIIPKINQNIKNYDCHGFLCVDCVKPNAFVGNYDFAILEGVADGIYDVISERNLFKYNSNEQRQN